VAVDEQVPGVALRLLRLGAVGLLLEREIVLRIEHRGYADDRRVLAPERVEALPELARERELADLLRVWRQGFRDQELEIRAVRPFEVLEHRTPAGDVGDGVEPRGPLDHVWRAARRRPVVLSHRAIGLVTVHPAAEPGRTLGEIELLPPFVDALALRL